MLIDKYLPQYQFSERHSIRINASADKVLQNAICYDLQNDFFCKTALILRELPNKILYKKNNHTIEHFSMKQFTCLETYKNTEVVFGLIGRFWQLNYRLNPCNNADDFLLFNQPNSAKLVFNFHTTALEQNKTMLSTETRILCTDKIAQRNFLYYWYLIRPISGMIRQRMLKTISKESSIKN
ncbi:hypothetical protein [Commensalibacter oyaizuii]|uniref:DUF2867 domain-containing protein n=1 Tax=Commensalibacter oyaizuii TaxID=3043873 RepID=A0ABT6PYI1_9PROT|nr:hypothetical protein [Commensalibacter sp. TBRC 16381]MDI2089914.1 hypothetical protein [Commensalibacter sp. TBRC 16381]